MKQYIVAYRYIGESSVCSSHPVISFYVEALTELGARELGKRLLEFVVKDDAHWIIYLSKGVM